jgi:hypothetical protein
MNTSLSSTGSTSTTSASSNVGKLLIEGKYYNTWEEYVASRSGGSTSTSTPTTSTLSS